MPAYLPFDTTKAHPEPRGEADTLRLVLHYQPAEGSERTYETTLGAAWCHDFCPYSHLTSAYENYDDAGACFYTLLPVRRRGFAADARALLAPFLVK